MGRIFSKSFILEVWYINSHFTTIKEGEKNWKSLQVN